MRASFPIPPPDPRDAAWDDLVATLPRAAALPPRAQIDAVAERAATLLDDVHWRALLLPSSVGTHDAAVARAHLRRESGRAVLRARLAPADASLREPGPHLLAPGVADALASGDGSRLAELLRPLGNRRHAGPLLSADTCARLLADVERVRAFRRTHDVPRLPPNSMHADGLQLDELGLRGFGAWLARSVVRPLAALHFADLGGATLADAHGFVVEYGEDAERALPFHVDDSEVTLNLCLGSSSAGGRLALRGLRCDAHAQGGWTRDEELLLEHVPGVALLHAGRDRHEALPIHGGRRVNLIVWCRSPTYRAEAREGGACRPWCGMHGASRARD
ncbi:MAG: hypothetical protein H6825_08180 [Planctomycetes bacterium]|nr:hypothetical protein [Planctomycetota bacterium]